MNRANNNLVPFSRTPDYWMMRAGKHKNNAEHSAAGFLYRQAFEQSHETDIALSMAENYYQMGCFAAARRIAAEILQREPDNAQAFYWLGLTALEAKDEELAEQALALALKKGRDLPLADVVQDLLTDYPWTEPPAYRRSQRAWSLYMRALNCLRSGDYVHAEEFLRKSIHRGVCPEAHALLGEMLFCRGKHAESLPCLRHAIVLMPDKPSLWFLLAQCAFSLNMNDTASNAFAHGLKLTQNAQEWGFAAAASIYLHDPDRLRTALGHARRNAPESNDLLYVSAALEANTGHLNEAIRYLNAILSRDPDDRDARTALCLIGYGPLPHYRFIDDGELVDAMCTEPPLKGDRALARLIHGLTISLGGAVAYREVYDLVSLLWGHMNPLQRTLCDRQNEWPNAFYQLLIRCFQIKDLPEDAALWPLKRHKRRVKRMRWYLTKTLVGNGGYRQ